MRIDLEELEDLLTVGEAMAAKNNEHISIVLALDTPESETADDDPNETIVLTGYRISFRPEPERVRDGISYVILNESEIDYMYTTKKPDGSITDWTFPVGFSELLEDPERAFQKREYAISFDGTLYTNKQQFLNDFGFDSLSSVTLRVPVIIHQRLRKLARSKGDTVTSHIRKLIENDLTEEIRTYSRREMFK